MRPLDIEVYENGDVGLEVHSFEDPADDVYWLRGGAGSIHFNTDGFLRLLDLLFAYDEEMMVEDEDYLDDDPLMGLETKIESISFGTVALTVLFIFLFVLILFGGLVL